MAWYTGINEKLRNYFHRAGQNISDSITVDEFAETRTILKEVLDEIKRTARRQITITECKK